MRLIDADELTDGKGVFSDVVHVDFEKGGGYIMVEDLLNILDNQPTAYDVNKVVSEMKEAISGAIQYKHKFCESVDEERCCQYKFCEECMAEMMIGIVKSGGIAKR